MSAPADSPWRNPANDETLKKLWADGLSAGDIAAEMGQGITRNAVIGRVHRLGLAGRATSANWQSSTKSAPKPQRLPGATSNRAIVNKANHARRRAETGAEEGPFEADALTDLPPDESPDAVAFLARSGNTCCWPLNDVVPIAAHTVCGAATFSRIMPDGKRREMSYCRRHFAISVSQTRAPRILSDADRAKRALQGRKNLAAYKERMAQS